MSSLSQVCISSTFPNVYKVELPSVNELLSTFSEDILQGCSFSNLESTLVDYITSVVEPVGWKAIWRSTNESTILNGLEYDFFVEVANVSLERLEAEVLVKSVIVPDSDASSVENLNLSIGSEGSLTVPLIELYVVSEDDYEEFYAKTAIAIAHVRFLLNHIKRPWDDEDDLVYSEELLKSRIQLYFDMKNNALPKTMIFKIKSILKEAARIHKQLDSLFTDMNASDSGAEITEMDLVTSMNLKKRLEKLQAKLEMLENPVIRSFVTKKYAPMKALRRISKSRPVTYVVSKQFTSEIISNLSIESNELLEFEHCPETAFKCSSTGDKIFIFPGTYQCDSLGWIEGNITVQGVGLNTDIVLEATGNSEVLLNSCAEKVELRNLTLKAKSGLLSALVVHHGKVDLKDCMIDSNEAEIGLLMLGGAEASLENVTICNSSEDGIQMRSLSSLHMKSSKVIFSERHGIQLDAETGLAADSYTDINILSSEITNNDGYGIFLNNVPITEISLQRPTGDFNILRLFPWLRHQIEDTILDQNGETGIGFSSSCKNNTSTDSPKTKPNCISQDELNYSALSDLLNEVNLSISINDSAAE